MDYFFWDEIFGSRQGVAENPFEEPSIEEPTNGELYSVIIACVETFQNPPMRPNT